MDMKVHLPVATLPLDNGCEYYYFNSQFLPIFYRIPKEILEIRGTEMMPFHNIFNEWYAAQTSKKIRAVWRSKSDKGERVSSAVPYGYMKSPDDSKQWIIDDAVADNV